MIELEAFLQHLRSVLSKGLRPPAEPSLLAQVPAQWRPLWAAHDGQTEEISGIFDGYFFMPLSGSNHSVEVVRHDVWLRFGEQYFPLATDFSGSYLAINEKGAVFELTRSEAHLVAKDLSSFCKVMKSTSAVPMIHHHHELRIDVTLPSKWAIGEAIKVPGTYWKLVRVGPECVDLELVMLSANTLIFALVGGKSLIFVGAEALGGGGLAETREGYLRVIPPRTHQVSVRLVVGEPLQRPPLPALFVGDYERAYASSQWNTHALAACRLKLPLRVPNLPVSAHDQLLVAYHSLCVEDFEAAKEALKRVRVHPGLSGRLVVLAEFVWADLLFAQGHTQKARRVISQVGPYELDFLSSLGPVEMRRVLTRRYLPTPVASASIKAELPLHPVVEYVCADHLRVHLSPEMARDGKTVAVSINGQTVGVRLPAGAGHGLSVIQRMEGVGVRIEAVVDPVCEQMSFDRWTVYLVDTTPNSSTICGPYGSIDRPKQSVLAAGGLVKPSGERGELVLVQEGDPVEPT